MFTVRVWKATHTGGTKFYQVASFVAPGKAGSISLRQFGPVGVFTGLGKLQTGSVEIDEVRRTDRFAGLAKIKDKKSGGYIKDIVELEEVFGDFGSLQTWIKKNIGPKGLQPLRKEMQGLNWASLSVPTSTAGAAKATTPNEPEETPLQKHKDWGTW